MAYAVPNPAIVATVSELWVPPLSPNAENDEFDSSTITGWTRNYTPSASAIDPLAAFAAGDPRESVNGLTGGVQTPFRHSWYLLQPSGPGLAVGPSFGLHKQFAGGGALPDGTYMIRCKGEYRFGGIVNDDGQPYLTLCATLAGAPDLANQVLISPLETDNGLIAPQANSTIAGVDNITQMPDQENFGDHFEYGAIIRSGNNFSCFAGNGVNWVYINTFNYTGIPPIDRVFLAISNNAATAPGNMIAGFDFFRYFATADLP